MTWEEKNEGRNKRKHTKEAMKCEVLLANTPHMLVKEGRSWKYARCCESVGRHQRSPAARRWMQRQDNENGMKEQTGA
eukprot:8940973-Pyramimonas_sp.AAC.1